MAVHPCRNRENIIQVDACSAGIIPCAHTTITYVACGTSSTGPDVAFLQTSSRLVHDCSIPPGRLSRSILAYVCHAGQHLGSLHTVFQILTTVCVLQFPRTEYSAVARITTSDLSRRTQHTYISVSRVLQDPVMTILKRASRGELPSK